VFTIIDMIFTIGLHFLWAGMVSMVCTRNENGTEIYNVTAYNYTCLPPCTPVLYTFQVLATASKSPHLSLSLVNLLVCSLSKFGNKHLPDYTDAVALPVRPECEVISIAAF